MNEAIGRMMQAQGWLWLSPADREAEDSLAFKALCIVAGLASDDLDSVHFVNTDLGIVSSASTWEELAVEQGVTERFATTRKEVMESLALLAPSIALRTDWVESEDILEDTFGKPGHWNENEDRDDWEAWDVDFQASVIVNGELIVGSSYMGDLWQKAQSDPAKDNPEVGGNWLQGTRDAVAELPESHDREVALKYLNGALLQVYEEWRAKPTEKMVLLCRFHDRHAAPNGAWESWNEVVSEDKPNHKYGWTPEEWKAVANNYLAIGGRYEYKLVRRTDVVEWETKFVEKAGA